MKSIIELFEIAQEATDDKTSAAILVLAWVIKEKELLDTKSGEIFGHELALALKDTFKESTIYSKTENL